MKEKTIVVLCGEANSGKGTVGSYLKNEYGFVTFSFAAILKDIIAYVYGLPRNLMEGDTDFSREWRETPHPALGGKTPRQAMNTLGTEGFRAFYGETWVNALIRSINLSKADRIVITDCRFENELNALKEVGATILFVERPLKLNLYQRLIRPFRHSSEKVEKLKQYSDFVLVNNSTINVLYEQVDRALSLPQYEQLELALFDPYLATE